MPYIDVTSQDAYRTFNIRLAKLTSLQVAVYWSEISSIMYKVIKKKAFDTETGLFMVDRNYIEDRTTLTKEEQLQCDNVLSNIGVLQQDESDQNKLVVDQQKMIEFLIDDTIVPNTKWKKLIGENKAQASARKKAGQIVTMKSLISEKDPVLRSKYESWVESVYAKPKGISYLNRAAINLFESAINSYSADHEIRSTLLDIAAATGYTKAEWVINKYEQDHPRRCKEQKITSTVNTTNIF
jgi:hypothetical protein